MIQGQRLRQLREAAGYSRKRFAEILAMGEAQVARYERGESDATGDVLARIAKLFDVSTDYLLGLTDNPFPKTLEGFAPDEIALLAARRRKDYREAIKLLVADE
jgi:transcriptional regulator with XRE-family HTH domain